jgi:hypothetical protein
MNETQDPSGEERSASVASQPCSCNPDPYAGLPPEARPKEPVKHGDLRNVECPGCGMDYWTNRATDLCIDCEGKATKRSASQSGGDPRPHSREEAAG